MPYKVIIIEDESAARIRMKRLLEKYQQDIQIIGEAKNGQDAIQKIENLKPDLLFLDIQMPDLNGFEVLAALSFQPLVVFTTAYQSYAIQAFEVHSVDYLVKPIEEYRLEKTIYKLQKFQSPNHSFEMNKLKQLFSQLHPKKEPFSLTIKNGDRIILLRFDEITHLQAEDKYVTVYTINGKKHITDLTLHSLTQRLTNSFIRIHRSTIINTDFILEAKRFFRGRFIITLRDKKGTNIRSSASYESAIKSALGL